VISYVDHYFENFGLGESHLTVHADNWCGQNKNNYLMAYLLWRAMTGKHRSIKLCFLPVGHTKFSPDWAFGMTKRKLRYTKVSCLSKLKDCIHASSPVSGANMACVTGNEDGRRGFKGGITGVCPPKPVADYRFWRGSSTLRQGAAPRFTYYPFPRFKSYT